MTPVPVAGRLVAAAILSAALTGCQFGTTGGGTQGTPAGGGRGARIAFVDFDRAVRAHPRWSELDALDQRIADLQARLAVPSSGSRIDDLGPELRAAAQQEIERLRPEFAREVQEQAGALQDAARKELEAYGAKLRADQQAEFASRRSALEAQGRKAIEDKQQALAKDNDQFQRQTLEQYRLPLLNLRLKLEAVQQTNRQEGDRLQAQMEAVTKERDAKIAAHEKANAQALEVFQQQQTQQYTTAVKDLQQQLITQGQTLMDQKTAEINARLHAQISAKQAEITKRLNERLQADLKARQERLVAGARQQQARAQTQAQGALATQAQGEEVQLQDARAERARLLATILADLRVEATELGQQQGYGVILTQTLATIDAVDITDDVIARLKR